MPEQLSHIDKKGNALMVDIGKKTETVRYARATGSVVVQPSTYKILKKGYNKKGDIFGTARIAGIMAAKKTGELIPLCHPLRIGMIKIDFKLNDKTSSCTIISEVSGKDRSGFELEALTAVSVACLTLYDMLKSVERGIVIKDIYLAEKSGGKSGHYSKEL